MKMRLLLNFVACSFLILSACGEQQNAQVTTIEKAAPEPAVKTIECQLKMGWDPWAPYQYLTPEGDVKGLDIELLSALADEAGCVLVFVQDNWMNLLTSIRNGNIDLLGGATKTQSREEFAYFSDSYRNETFLVYIRDGEAGNYAGKGLGDLLTAGFRLGVTQDYIYGDEVNDLQDNENFTSNFVSVPITEVNYYNLTQGNIDGFLEDPFVAAFTIRGKGLQGQIEALDIEIQSDDVSIIFSKESVKEETVEAFNAALVKLGNSGKLDEILSKYRR